MVSLQCLNFLPMKHILVPIGATENALNTLQYAIDFASKTQAKVFVFRAYNLQTKAGTIINIDEIMARETNLYLRTMVSAANIKDVDIQLIAAKGGVIDSITAIDKELGIDFIIVGAKSNSIKDEVFLGKTTGSIVKNTQIPVLIIPRGYTFTPFTAILTAFKSGVIQQKEVLKPLQQIKEKFAAAVHLLLVKTPKHTEEDLVIDARLEALQTSFSTSENGTTYQGVLENFTSHSPDLLCVFRRKRGFFKKLWEKNTILKAEFYCSVPLLVLNGRA
jgi:nucleotide-binding universal stress UspA family protein